MDVVALAQALIRCRTVTPSEGGALDLVATQLARLGFAVERPRFTQPDGVVVDNLYARFGTSAPVIAFAGHVDVVPPGDATAWAHEPFAADLGDDVVYGRGAVDMKGSIAAFLAAVDEWQRARAKDTPGSLVVLLTCDEEGIATHGTRELVPWLTARGVTLDACLVGEPTSRAVVGDTLKVGRRGSFTAQLTVLGTQGHVAYPERADNPVHRLARIVADLVSQPLDRGTPEFEPSSLQVVSLDVGNRASNVIPARASALLNIRFNPLHTGASLEQWLRQRLDASGARYELSVSVAGEAFVTPRGPWLDVVGAAVQSVIGGLPEASTTGGTSDARFLTKLCPVVELGLVGDTMHRVDERVPVADLRRLVEIYVRVLERALPAKPGAIG